MLRPTPILVAKSDIGMRLTYRARLMSEPS